MMNRFVNYYVYKRVVKKRAQKLIISYVGFFHHLVTTMSHVFKMEQKQVYEPSIRYRTVI